MPSAPSSSSSFTSGTSISSFPAHVSQTHLPLRTAAYRTPFGAAYIGDSAELLAELPDDSVNLIMTSPPFPLLRQKAYGNVNELAYVDWLSTFAKLAHAKLRDDGSLVVDLGGTYRRGLPVRSLYNFRVLLHFCDDLGYHLAEEFYWFNPAKLPSPTEWVNKRKIRVKDAVDTVWWFSKTPWPQADVRAVLTPYSERMKRLIRDPAAAYAPVERPSGHAIGEGFGRDNGGAIPPNLLSISNTGASGRYLNSCRQVGVPAHPARFPPQLPEFFIRFLSRPGDLVLDFFSGSNTTGAVAEAHARRWLAFEARADYVAASAFRFMPPAATPEQVREVHRRVMAGDPDVFGEGSGGAL